MLEMKITISAPALEDSINRLSEALRHGRDVCNQYGENNAHIGAVGTLTMDDITAIATPAPAPVTPSIETPAPFNPAATVPVAPPAATVPPVAPAPGVPLSATPAPITPTAPAAPYVPSAAPVTNPAPAVPTSAPTYTLEMIARAGTALIDAGKMDALCALLAKYRVETLTALDPALYGSFAAELRNLGARI